MRQVGQKTIISIIASLLIIAGVTSVIAIKAFSKPAAAVSVTTPVTPVTTCQPYGSNTDPGALDLSSAATGLTQQIDAPTTYQIYGNSHTDLEQQIATCAPTANGAASAEFTAETSYRLSWRYDFSRVTDSTCSVTNIRLGLHVGMVLPLWQPTASAQTGLPSQWQTFMTNLRTHENGHVALDQQYSQQLLKDLQAFPSSDCDTISASVSHLINSSVDSLNQANDNYDSATNHGATQGAILP